LVREKSRDYLTSLGYVLCVADVGCNKYNSYEDWWIHPDLVDCDVLDRVANTDNTVKRGQDILINKL
jgi:hypothetical protein